MSFILANNTKYSFEKLETWILQSTKQLFDGNTNFNVEFKHQFSGEPMRWYGCWAGYLQKGC